MKNSAILLMALFLGSAWFVQGKQSPASAPPAEDYSGMYAFLQDGEFVQITIDDQGQVTGLVSRYADSAGDKREFLDQFFKDGKLEGKKLNFTTKTVHDVWYEFQGTVERGDAQNAGDEGYHVLKGKLTEHSADVKMKNTVKSRDVAFKSFPKDTDSAPAK